MARSGGRGWRSEDGWMDSWGRVVHMYGSDERVDDEPNRSVAYETASSSRSSSRDIG